MTSKQLTESRAGVSPDTATRVDLACAAAGFASWDALVLAAKGGALFRVDFASKRPANFVKELADMIRAGGLALCADSALDVYLGTQAALQPVIDTGHAAPTAELRELGRVQLDEAGGVSGASRSAGLHQIRRTSARELDGVRVLILDDDAVSRRVMSAMLERAGSDVVAAGDAETAFAQLRRQPPDLVVLDIVLGGAVDGFEFCRAMRANAGCAQVPAIFVTGHAGPAWRGRSADVQASAYFEKPVRAAELRAAVAGLARGVAVPG